MPSSRRLNAAAVAVFAAVAFPALFQAAPGAASSTPRVSVISDSVLTAVTWGNDPAQAALSGGLDLQIDAGVCRRLNGQSCEFNGAYVPTTLAVINSWGSRPRLDRRDRRRLQRPAGNFANDVELTLNTLRNDGVQHVLWVNLHEVQPEFVAKNAVLAAAAQHHPELRVLDWNSYSAAHPEWFQTDFIHLRPAGGLAIAAWIHQAIADTLAPPPPPPPALQPSRALVVPAQKLVGQVGAHFARRLRPAGEQRRFTGAQRVHAQRARLHLLAGGELTGETDPCEHVRRAASGD